MSSDDIVERLRLLAKMYPQWGEVKNRSNEAAYEVERLRAEVERQRATILLLGLADIERLAADNERLRDERRTERAEVERLRDAGDQLAYHVRAENAKEMYTAVRMWEEARRG